MGSDARCSKSGRPKQREAGACKHSGVRQVSARSLWLERKHPWACTCERGLRMGTFASSWSTTLLKCNLKGAFYQARGHVSRYAQGSKTGQTIVQHRNETSQCGWPLARQKAPLRLHL